MELALDRLSIQDEMVSHFFFPSLGVCRPRPALAAEGVTYDPLEDDEEPIRIPETILYSFGKPICWLYYDDASRCIRRRPQKSLTSPVISDVFSAHAAANGRAGGILAWFFRAMEFKSGSTGEARESDEDANSDFPYEILTQDQSGRLGLTHFLQETKVKGILQYFEENRPQSDGSLHNVFISCVFSPSYFRVEQHISRHSLPSGQSLSGEGSCVDLGKIFSPHTYPYERRQLVSSVVNIRLHRLCTSIARRLKRTLDYTVASMNLMCRMDSQDRLFVTCVNSLQLHSPRRFPDSSFRMTPAGTLKMPYSIDKRAGGSDSGGKASASEDGSPDRHPSRRQWAVAVLQAGPCTTDTSSSKRKSTGRRSSSVVTCSTAEGDGLVSGIVRPIDRLYAAVFLEGGPWFFSAASSPEGTCFRGQQFEDDSIETGDDHGTVAVKGDKKGNEKASSSGNSSSRSGPMSIASCRPKKATDENQDERKTRRMESRCVVCSSTSCEGDMSMIPALWPVFLLSTLDGAVSQLEHTKAASGKVVQIKDGVPPSVGLVFPNLSFRSFQQLVEEDIEGYWLRKAVMLCPGCSDKAVRANEQLAEGRVAAPRWLRLDEAFTARGARRKETKELVPCTSDAQPPGRLSSKLRELTDASSPAPNTTDQAAATRRCDLISSQMQRLPKTIMTPETTALLLSELQNITAAAAATESSVSCSNNKRASAGSSWANGTAMDCDTAAGLPVDRFMLLPTEALRARQHKAGNASSGPQDSTAALTQSRVGSSNRRSMDHVEHRTSVTALTSAVRSDPNACDLYRKDSSTGLWKKAGFGKPAFLTEASGAKDVFRGPHETRTIAIHREDLVRKLEAVAIQQPDDILKELESRRSRGDDDSEAPAAPSSTPRH
jgi:hypothetical protein